MTEPSKFDITFALTITESVERGDKWDEYILVEEVLVLAKAYRAESKKRAELEEENHSLATKNGVNLRAWLREKERAEKAEAALASANRSAEDWAEKAGELRMALAAAQAGLQIALRNVTAVEAGFAQARAERDALAKQNLDIEARWLMTRDALESAEYEVMQLKAKLDAVRKEAHEKAER